MRELDPKSPAPLEADGISVGYDRKAILDRLDLAIPPAGFTVLVGPNGCGKSTLLRALSGTKSSSRGRILLDGRSIQTMSAKEIARQLGILAQGPAAPEGLTVKELIRQGRYPHQTLFGRWNEDDASACAEALRLTALEQLADRPLDTLSGGQKQRAWIAMTLAQRSGILLLDEPTTYLDMAHQIDILDLLRRLVIRQGSTVVAVLHDINQAARYADHLVVMKEGRIAAAGSARDVITPAILLDVFGVKAQVIENPIDGTPLTLLEGTSTGQR